ncbi:response regulator [bacterium]|nr:response regulator [bacterium]
MTDFTLKPEPLEIKGIENVLVVDDESSPRKILTQVLRDIGYHVVDLDHSDKIEQEFQKNDIQLILLDIRMPGANGLDVLKKIKSSHPYTMVIMVTAVFETETAVEAMKLGAIDYITKPFNIDSVVMGVGRANDMYVLRSENQQYKEGLENLVQQRTEQLFRFADALSKKNQMIVKTNKELKAANEKLQGFLNQAMVMDKVSTIGLLSSMLIHGIANPLGVIKGIGEVMGKRFAEDPVTSKEIGMMQGYLQQVLELVNQIRSFAKTEVIQFTRVNMADVIKNSIALFHALMKKNTVAIQADLSATELWINGNQSQLEQVLVNVIQNAIHAIETEGTIRIYDQNDEKGFMKIIIEDSGKGIPPEHMERIFRMFFTTKTGGHGTGLGLFICKEIIEKHAGTIQIESQQDKGTRIIIRLPKLT